MSDEQPSAAAPLPAPPRRGCAARLFAVLGWLTTLLLAVVLSLLTATLVFGYLFNGPLAAPQQLMQYVPAMATSRSEMLLAQTTIADLETQLRDQSAALDGARERVDALESAENSLAAAATSQAQQVATMVAVGRDIAVQADQVATTQALAEADQVTRAVMATMQVIDSRRIDELSQQTDQLNRFVTRLGDLAAALGSMNPTQQPLPSPTAATTVTVEPTAGTRP